MAKKKGPLELPILPVQSSPCKDCTTRSLGCHSDCGHYHDFRAFCDRVAAERRQRVEINDYVSDVMKHLPGKRSI